MGLITLCTFFNTRLTLCWCLYCCGINWFLIIEVTASAATAGLSPIRRLNIFHMFSQSSSWFLPLSVSASARRPLYPVGEVATLRWWRRRQWYRPPTNNKWDSPPKNDHYLPFLNFSKLLPSRRLYICIPLRKFFKVFIEKQNFYCKQAQRFFHILSINPNMQHLKLKLKGTKTGITSCTFVCSYPCFFYCPHAPAGLFACYNRLTQN